MPDPRYYPCPCCGHYVFRDPPGSYDICSVCFWEDDAYQLRFASTGGGANAVSLVEGQRNYAAYGACEPRFASRVRPPREDEPREHGWRPIDLDRDSIEKPDAEADGSAPCPSDRTMLYYWRPTFWRSTA